MKRFMLIRLLIAAAFLVTASFWAVNPSYGAEDIVIGVIAPYSGSQADMGLQYKKGLELAVKEINAAGGINGRKVKLLQEDDQGNPKESASIAQKFTANPEIAAVIGPNSSARNFAILPILEKAKLVNITPVSSTTNLAPSSKYMFQAFSTVDRYTTKIVEYIVKKLGGKRLALVYVVDDWGKEGKEIFYREAKKLGVEVVAEASFKWGDKDFKAQMTHIKAANPDVIHIFGLYTEPALATKEARDLGITAKIIGNVGILFDKFIELGGKATEGVIATAEFFHGDPNPDVQNFVKKFNAEYGQNPGPFSATAYDALKMVLEAIRKVGTQDRDKIQEALAQTKDFPGTTGALSFSPQRQVIRRTSWVEVKDGKWQSLPD